MAPTGMLPLALPRIIIAERRETTAPTSDLRVQEFVATVRGGFSDVAWQAPEFDPATRQLVGFELFRDDTSTDPPFRLTWRTMPPGVVEARGLEIVPHGEYGVQPIWRRATESETIAAIEYGPARLAKDLAGPAIVVPAEHRIHSLAYLQRQGAITSEEMELAIDRLLGRAQPPIEDAPKPKALISVDAAGGSSAKTRRLAFAYIATATVLVLALVGAQQLVGRLRFTKPSATNIAAPTPSAQPSPSPSPTPTAVVVNLRSVLIRTADLRPGYVADQYGSDVLCPKCAPQLASLSLAIANARLQRNIFSAATVAPSARDAAAIAKALVAYLAVRNVWTAVPGLGDQSYATSVYSPGARSQRVFYVVWRTGVITNEITLVGPSGALTIQNAIDLARVQQARAVKALG